MRCHLGVSPSYQEKQQDHHGDGDGAHDGGGGETYRPEFGSQTRSVVIDFADGNDLVGAGTIEGCIDFNQGDSKRALGFVFLFTKVNERSGYFSEECTIDSG